MPNVKYSGAQGIVQSTGTGGFTVSGVGVTLDAETVAFTASKAIASVGVTKCTSDDNARVGTIASPVNVAGAAGQTKLVHKTAAGGKVQLADANGNIVGSLLNGSGDFCFLVWTGSAWVPVAQKITA